MNHPAPGKYAFRKCRSSGKWLVWWPNAPRPAYGFATFGRALSYLRGEPLPLFPAISFEFRK